MSRDKVVPHIKTTLIKYVSVQDIEQIIIS